MLGKICNGRCFTDETVGPGTRAMQDRGFFTDFWIAAVQFKANADRRHHTSKQKCRSLPDQGLCTCPPEPIIARDNQS